MTDRTVMTDRTISMTISSCHVITVDQLANTFPHVPHPQVENRKELTTNGKQHLSMYAGQSVPFATWLSSAEEKLHQLGALPRSKEKLFSTVEEFQVRKNGLF